jgi:hypothetical protein
MEQRPPSLTTALDEDGGSVRFASWRAAFAAMAADIGFYTDHVDIAAADVRKFLAEIDAC